MTDKSKLITAEEHRKRYYRALEKAGFADSHNEILDAEFRNCQSQTLEVAAGVCDDKTKGLRAFANMKWITVENSTLHIEKAASVEQTAAEIRALKEE